MSKTKKGAALLGAIRTKAASRQQNFHYACLAMEISPTFLAEIFSPESKKSVDSLSNVYLKKIASYLEVPLAQVYILAGILSPSDFVLESDFSQDFQRILHIMRQDHLWTGLVPDDETFAKTGTDIKLLIALLYERVTTQSLIAKANIDSGSFEQPAPSNVGLPPE